MTKPLSFDQRLALFELGQTNILTPKIEKRLGIPPAIIPSTRAELHLGQTPKVEKLELKEIASQLTEERQLAEENCEGCE